MASVEFTECERDEIADFIERHWHSHTVISGGREIRPHLERGLVERRGDQIVGLLTFRTDQDGMELLTLNSDLEGQGIGTQLMLAAIDIARREGLSRIWLTTTNDNLRVVSFNQRLGFRMVEIRLGAVDEARKLKPQIPQFGERGIRMQDEIVMELRLKPYLDE
jgi:ribosomal protein S18 acetylase RimI-like enzyme